MKTIKQILTTSISLIILLVGFIFYQIKYETQADYLVCQIPVPFCGTNAPPLTESQEKGRELFNSNCAACHKLDYRSTGPPLRNRDSLVFAKWILQKNYKIDSIKIEKLGIDYHKTMFKEYINKENLPLIIDYCSRPRY